MAAPWLHTGFLLVLVATWCPGSRGTATQLLCGSHLVDALNVICGERGFRYMPTTDDNPVLRSLVARAASSGGQNEVAKFPLKDQTERRVKRSFTVQCCLQPCSLYDLQDYCN